MDWKALKKAADIAAPDEGWADNNRRIAPSLPYEEQQRRQAASEAFDAHFQDPHSWMNALKTYGGMLGRGALKMTSLPYAAISYPVSWFGKIPNYAMYRTGRITPGQYEANRKAYDLVNWPVEWWNRNVTDRIQYPEELKDAPGFNFLTGVGEDLAAMKFLQTGTNALANVGRRMKDAFTMNRLGRQSSGDYVATRYTDPLKDEKIRKAFRDNGLDPDKYEFNNNYVANDKRYLDFMNRVRKNGRSVHDTEAYRPGVHVRSNGDGPRGNLMESQELRTAVDRSYAKPDRPLWVAPRESEYVTSLGLSKPESSISTLDDRFLVKWDNGRPVYVPDATIEHDKYLGKLADRGADLTQFISRHGFHTGRPRIMKAFSYDRGWAPNQISRQNLGKALASTPSETVRIVPKGTVDPTADVIDFAPNFNMSAGYRYRPVFTRKGAVSGFSPKALRHLSTAPVSLPATPFTKTTNDTAAGTVGK